MRLKQSSRYYAQDNILAYTTAPGVVRTRMSEEFARASGGEESVALLQKKNSHKDKNCYLQMRSIK
jgi:hypothetical protein